MSIYLECDESFDAPCRTCKATGTIGDQYCWTCSGAGCHFLASTMATLLHNVAIAVALSVAYARGRVDGIEDGKFLASCCGGET